MNRSISFRAGFALCATSAFFFAICIGAGSLSRSRSRSESSVRE
jgi:hypothetical protein|uniref:Uncharacterized protein n=1 Tax=Picea glauca TaxID=3330 RepID=A0A101LUS9_PICGL|nr:hypothetical protein ABT39_MTgene2286 [Picea glauca]